MGHAAKERLIGLVLLLVVWGIMDSVEGTVRAGGTAAVRAREEPLTSSQRHSCQFPTPSDPLYGCPPGTLLVDHSLSPTRRSPQHLHRRNQTVFPDIQSAVLSLPQDNSSQTILILPGIYTQQINITRPGPLTLLGTTTSPSSISQNTVHLLWHQATGTNTTGTLDNAYTSTLTVAPTLNASLTGSGPSGFPVPADTPFGCSDFKAYNLNITNEYLPYSAGPSLAIGISYARASFYKSSVLSHQDTVYVGKNGSVFLGASRVGGQTDFLYGYGKLWVEESEVIMRGCGGGIVAWKSPFATNYTSIPASSSTDDNGRFGAYIHNSRIEKENETLQIQGKCSLGRPWNSKHRSVFSDCWMDESVRKEGYSVWQKAEPRITEETFMTEYRSRGPGWNEEGRREGNVTRLLTDEEWEMIGSPEKVFGDVGWIDGEFMGGRHVVPQVGW